MHNHLKIKPYVWKRVLSSKRCCAHRSVVWSLSLTPTWPSWCSPVPFPQALLLFPESRAQHWPSASYEELWAVMRPLLSSSAWGQTVPWTSAVLGPSCNSAAAGAWEHFFLIRPSSIVVLLFSPACFLHFVPYIWANPKCLSCFFSLTNHSSVNYLPASLHAPFCMHLYSQQSTAGKSTIVR